jgi:hypothetical protein
MSRQQEIEAQKNYYRNQIIQSYKTSLNEGVYIDLIDIASRTDSCELGEYVRAKFEEKQTKLLEEIQRLEDEKNSST